MIPKHLAAGAIVATLALGGAATAFAVASPSPPAVDSSAVVSPPGETASTPAPAAPASAPSTSVLPVPGNVDEGQVGQADEKDQGNLDEGESGQKDAKDEGQVGEQGQQGQSGQQEGDHQDEPAAPGALNPAGSHG
jgi:hypothetical protein